MAAEADMAGTLFASRLSLFAGYTDPSKMRVEAGFERVREPVDLVLAIDMKLKLDGRRARNPDQSRLETVRRAALQVVDIFDGSAHIGVIPWSNVVNAARA